MHRWYLQEKNDTCNMGQTQNVTFAETGFTDQVDQVLALNKQKWPTVQQQILFLW